MSDRRGGDDGGDGTQERRVGSRREEGSVGKGESSPPQRPSIQMPSGIGGSTAAPPADFMSSWLGDSVNMGGSGLGGETSMANLDFNQSFGSMSLGVGSSMAGSAFNLSMPISAGMSVTSSVGAARHRRSGSSEAGPSSTVRGARGSLSSRSVSLGGSGVGHHHPHGGEVGGGGFESSLHDAARVTDWTEVHRLALSEPRMARFAGPDGWTALHHALSRRGCPPAVVKALILAYPGALVHQNESKWTPLHFACRFKAPREVVRILLDASPRGEGRRAASMRCSKGRTALYYAVRYDAPDGVEELLLDAHPGAVLDEDRDGVSPLALVWDKYATRLEGKQALHPYLQQTPGAEGNTVVLGGKLKARWVRADRLLRAAFRFPYQDKKKKAEAASKGRINEIGNGDADAATVPQSQEKPRKWRILHATAAIKCHSSLFELASVLHPEQASEVDEGDLYGSHGIDAESRLGHSRSKPPASKVGYGGFALGDEEENPENEPADDGKIKPSHRTALHFAALSPARGRAGRTVLATLLKLYPAAAAAADEVDGSLPLHLLAENGRKGHWVHDGVAELCAAYPDAVRALDGKGRTALHRACAVVSQRGAGGGAQAAGRPSRGRRRMPPPPPVREAAPRRTRS